MLDDLWLHNVVLARRFPDGVDPFKMVARLTEECGELATEVQIWENVGLKRDRHGDPSRTNTAKEVMDVMRVALQIASYYGLEQELERCITDALDYAKREGTITEEEIRAHRIGH